MIVDKLLLTCRVSFVMLLCSDVYALDLQTLTWRKVNPGNIAGTTSSTSGTGRTRQKVLLPKAAWHASTQWGSYMVAYIGGLNVWGFDMVTEEWCVWKGSGQQKEMLRA